MPTQVYSANEFKRMNTPRYESDVQRAFVRMMELNKTTRDVFFHSIPNENASGRRMGKRLNDMGRKKGVPDILIPFRTSEFGGLYIEFKLLGEKTSKAQKEARRRLTEQGFKIEVHTDAIEAWESVCEFIGKNL